MAKRPQGGLPTGGQGKLNTSDLIEIEAIKRVKYRYIRCLDQKLWDEMATCFTDDAVAAYSGGKYRYEGRDAIIEFLTRSMGADTFHSSHRVHQPEIDLTGPDTATGTWAMDDVVVMTDWQLTVRGAAFYTDEYLQGRRRVEDRPDRLQAHLRGDAAPGRRRRPAAHRQLVDDRRRQQHRRLRRRATGGPEGKDAPADGSRPRPELASRLHDRRHGSAHLPAGHRPRRAAGRHRAVPGVEPRPLGAAARPVRLGQPGQGPVPAPSRSSWPSSSACTWPPPSRCSSTSGATGTASSAASSARCAIASIGRRRRRPAGLAARARHHPGRARRPGLRALAADGLRQARRRPPSSSSSTA